ncbi:MAG: nucleotidyl transferase AbiEii/AbiGii toxin family protein [Patescibacteria group bacterium]
MIDHTSLTQLAQNLEIDTFTVMREYLQIQFLEQIYKDQRFVKTYFKGGTCLRLVYKSSRFSEDLDFTTSLPIHSLAEILDETIKKLANEFIQLSWREVKSLQGFSAKLYFPVDFARQPLTVKLDFSQRESVIEPSTSPIETSLPVGGVNLVEHLSAREIGAEKVRALLHRDKGRDVFDLWYILHKNFSLDVSLILRKLKFYHEPYDKHRLVEKIENLSEKDILQDLQRFVPKSERKILPHLKRLLLAQVEEKL